MNRFESAADINFSYRTSLIAAGLFSYNPALFIAFLECRLFKLGLNEIICHTIFPCVLGRVKSAPLA